MIPPPSSSFTLNHDVHLQGSLTCQGNQAALAPQELTHIEGPLANRPFLQVSVVSYNILAQSLVKLQNYGVDGSVLRWRYRRSVACQSGGCRPSLPLSARPETDVPASGSASSRSSWAGIRT